MKMDEANDKAAEFFSETLFTLVREALDGDYIHPIVVAGQLSTLLHAINTEILDRAVEAEAARNQKH
jgi:hypothetical protein